MVCFGRHRSKLSTKTITFLFKDSNKSSNSFFKAVISFGAELFSSLSISFKLSFPLLIISVTFCESSSPALPLIPFPIESIAFESNPNVGTPKAKAVPSAAQPRTRNLLILFPILNAFSYNFSSCLTNLEISVLMTSNSDALASSNP